MLLLWHWYHHQQKVFNIDDWFRKEIRHEGQRRGNIFLGAMLGPDVIIATDTGRGLVNKTWAQFWCSDADLSDKLRVKC